MCGSQRPRRASVSQAKIKRDGRDSPSAAAGAPIGSSAHPEHRARETCERTTSMMSFRTIAAGAAVAAAAAAFAPWGTGVLRAEPVTASASAQWLTTGDGNHDVTWSAPTTFAPQGGGTATLSGGGGDAEVI